MRLVTSIQAAILFCAASATNAQQIAVFSYADSSCGAWARSATSESARAQYMSWFRGFVTGYNFANPENQVAMGRMPDGDTLALYIDKYCRENPLNPFVSAAFKLVEELRQPSLPAKSKPKR